MPAPRRRGGVGAGGRARETDAGSAPGAARPAGRAAGSAAGRGSGRTGPLPADLAAAIAARPALAGTPIAYVPVLASTNDRAAAWAADGAADGAAVIAGRQTAGRGRRGRAWHSPPDAGLYLSVALRGPQPPVVTLLAGVAVAEAIRGVAGVAAELKWPNDLVVGPPAADRRRKIGGILAEALPPAAGAGAVIGIGVNVGPVRFPPALADRAGAVAALTARPVARGALCAEILVRLAAWRRRLAAGETDAVIARWRALSPGSRGAAVSWDRGGAICRGVTAGVDATGALLVVHGGRTERLVGGEVRWDL